MKQSSSREQNISCISYFFLWSIWAIIFFAECKRDSSFSPRWAFESSPPLRHCPNNSIPFLSSFWVFSSGTLLCGCNAESLQTMWRFLRRWEAPFYSADIHSSPSIDFFQGRLCVHSAKHSPLLCPNLSVNLLLKQRSQCEVPARRISFFLLGSTILDLVSKVARISPLFLHQWSIRTTFDTIMFPLNIGRKGCVVCAGKDAGTHNPSPQY